MKISQGVVCCSEHDVGGLKEAKPQSCISEKMTIFITGSEPNVS